MRRAVKYWSLSMTIFVCTLVFSGQRSISTLAATITDNSLATFNGTYSNTSWNATNNYIELNTAGKTARTGTYTSPIRSSNYSNSLQTLAWIPAQPYGKELPNSPANETIFTSGNANMSNNQLLLHLNEASNATSFTDNSASNRVVTCVVATCPTFQSNGVLSNSRGFNGSSTILTSTTDFSTVVGGTATVAFWIKTTQVGSGSFWNYPGVVGVEQVGGGNDIFFGILNNTGRIGFQVGDDGNVYTTQPINDGTWQHIVITRNITSGVIQIFRNGALDSSSTLAAGPGRAVKNSPFSTIGRIQNLNTATGQYLNGSLDELVMYTRVLTNAEIVNLFKRGAARILFQLRTCPTSNCLGVNFRGPTSTTDYYRDTSIIANTLPTTQSLSQFQTNTYFQYQVTLEMDKGTSSTPFLKSVTLTYTNAGLYLAFKIKKDDTSDTQVCNLGQTSIATTKSCSYRLMVSTNAISGYQIFVKTDGGLKTFTNTIADAAVGNGGSGGSDISNSTLNTEKYGVTISPGSITGTGSISLNNIFNAGTNNAVRFNVPNYTLLATSTGANMPEVLDLSKSVQITHKLNINTDTKPGNYSQKVTYTITPIF
jgi:hypothetical protein